LKADMLCHLLLGLYGPPRSAQSLPAADLKVALAEKRVLEVVATRDDFGSGAAGVFRATPDYNVWGTGAAIPWRHGNCPVLPCVITDEILACLQRKNRRNRSPDLAVRLSACRACMMPPWHQ